MELMVRLVDWDETSKRQEAGTLHATYSEALDNEEPWIEYYPLDNDSFRTCDAVNEAYDALRSHLPDSTRTLADTYMNAAIWRGESDAHPNDLGEEESVDSFHCALAPDRVRGLADAASRLNLGDFESARGECPEDTWEDCDYEEDFVPFVEQFKSLFEAAAMKDRGVLIFVG